MKNNEILMWVLVAVLFTIFSGFGMMGFGGYGMYGMMGYGYGFPIFGWIFMTLIVVALVLLIIWLFKQIQK